MASFSIEINSNDGRLPLSSGDKRKNIVRLINFLSGAAGGANHKPLTISAKNTLVAATGTVTCASVSAADTVTINGVVFTAVNGGTPGANEFDMSGTDTVDAASLAAAINASASALVSNHVTATSALGVVTLTAKNKGYPGNAVTVATSNGTRLAPSGARLTGGSSTALTTMSF